MRISPIFPAIAFLVAGWAWSSSDAVDRVAWLADGGRIVVRADGTMTHYNAAGAPVAMADGVVMTLRDGSRVMMKNQTLWREVLESAAQAVAQGFANPFGRSVPGERVIELADGGRIVLGRGAMTHYDAAGRRILMADGEEMLARDGTSILMTNGALWGRAPADRVTTPK